MTSSTSHLVEWTTGNFRDAGSVPSTMASATLSEQITVRQSPIEQSHTAGFDVSKLLRLIKALCLTALRIQPASDLHAYMLPKRSILSDLQCYQECSQITTRR